MASSRPNCSAWPEAITAPNVGWRTEAVGYGSVQWADGVRGCALSPPSMHTLTSAPTPPRIVAQPAQPGAPLSDHSDAKANQLLAALPPAEWLRWVPQLEAVE